MCKQSFIIPDDFYWTDDYILLKEMKNLLLFFFSNWVLNKVECYSLLYI